MRKNVIITGASGNLGKATVERFVNDGYQVLATVSPGKLKNFQMQGVVAYEADLSNEGDVASVMSKIISEHKTIDAAILLVGGFAQGDITETDSASLKKMMAINFDTAYNVVRPVFQQMLEQSSGGRIVMVGARPSLNADEGKDTLAYALSKSLIFKLSEILNASAKGKNVVSTVIVPSTLDTPANRAANPSANFSDWVQPNEVATIMEFITSDKSRALRNTVLHIYSSS